MSNELRGQNGRFYCTFALVFGSFASLASLHAQPSSSSTAQFNSPVEQGVIVGWGQHLVGTNDCNLNFVAVAAGNQHNLALKDDGTIIGWGSNFFGQTSIPMPNADFVAIGAGAQHSLALKADGSVVSWGYISNVPTPNTDFAAIAAGSDHNLGLKRNGSIVAWGYNYSGQLDVPIPNIGFAAVAAGAAHSLALKADGSLVAWGCITSNFRQCETPYPNSGFVAIAAGGVHNLGLKQDGSIVAWGHNLVGQLAIPEPNADFVAIAAGGWTSLGLKSDGSLVVWGSGGTVRFAPGPYATASVGASEMLAINSEGSIVASGDSSNSETDVPSPNIGFVAIAGGPGNGMGLRADGSISVWGASMRVPVANSNFVRIGARYPFQWAFKSDGTLVEWGSVAFTTLPSDQSFVDVSRGTRYVAGLKSDGSVHYARTKNGFPMQELIPVPNADFTAVAVGDNHAIGLKSDGTIVKWGATSGVPHPNMNFVAIAAGHSHNLGLKADGSIVGWPSSAATQVPAPNADFVAIAAGYDHSVGLKADGTIVAWGANQFGQRTVPVSNSDFIAISAGFQGSLALGRTLDCNENGRSDSCDIEAADVPDVDEDAIPDECQPPFTLDIRPWACPNVLNGRRRIRVPVALVTLPRGSVSDIDVESITMKRADGVGDAVRPKLGFRGRNVIIKDLTAPFEGPSCACGRLGPDGLDDMLLEFSLRELVRKFELGSLPGGTSIELTLEGFLIDGSSFEASDCILLSGNSTRTQFSDTR